MSDFLLLGLLVTAIAIGWFMGRRSQQQATMQNQVDERYVLGLNYLLNHETDAALDLFIDSLEVNQHNLETHLALGNAFRRKGEVDKAIHIHQNLINQSGLTHSQLAQAQLELAHDFIKAGLLDRAEQLLLESAGFSPNKEVWGRLLLDIYQREKDWDKAIQVGRRFQLQDIPDLAVRLSHYACEQAQQHLQDDEEQLAKQQLQQASRLAADNPRIPFLKAQILMRNDDFRAAAAQLQQIAKHDPSLIPVILPDLALCYQHIGTPEAWFSWLEQSMAEHPSTSAMLAKAEQLRQQSDAEAAAYVTKELRKRPSVKGFNYLIDLHMQWASEAAKESLEALQGLTVALEKTKPAYRCKQCGFASSQLQWQCPTCHQWDTTKPHYGLRGE